MREEVRKRISRFFRNLLSEIFPDKYTCIFCGKELYTANRLGTCDECQKALPFIGNAFCVKCGKPFMPQGADKPQPLWGDDGAPLDMGYCSICRKAERNFDRVRSVFAYLGPARDVVHRLKYSDARYLAPYLTAYIADAYFADVVAVDMITAVPMHPKRRRARGYNQSELLARSLADRLRVPFLPDGLVKARMTESQTHLSYRGRQENLQSAFACYRPEVQGKCVLVVDDVLTTGATMSEAARALKAAGAVHVYGMTLANVPDTID